MSSIEKLSSADTLVFDKTGTLTSGSPAVENVILLGSQSKHDYLSISASMEQGSQHPFAKAIITATTPCSIEKYPTKNLKQYIGQGVEAVIENNIWRFGFN